MKNRYLNELFTGSLVMGLGLVVIMVLQYAIRNMQVGVLAALLSLGGFAVIVVTQVIYGRRVASDYGDAGFGYVRAFGLLILMSGLGGVIYGAGTYMMQTIVDPAYYGELQSKVIEAYVKTFKLNAEQIGLFKQAQHMMNNVAAVVFSGAIGLMLQGGLVGLFTATFVKRPAAPTPNNPDPGTI